MECHNIMVISVGLNQHVDHFISSMLNVLCGTTDGTIYAILGRSNIYEHPSKQVVVKNIITSNELKAPTVSNRIIKDICTQLSILIQILFIKNTNICIFFLSQSLILPMVLLKLSKKKVVLASGASYSHLSQSRHDGLFRILQIEEKINYYLADYIILYSNTLIDEWGLQRYKHKILIGSRHYVDLSLFKVSNPISERENIIGYIGRLSEEKGIINLLLAIKGLMDKKKISKFLIIGDGQLNNEIKSIIKSSKLENNIELIGWINHDEIPSYLNKLKLLVLPSSTEGLPNIVLEAMACGTPVLATPVGSVSNVIKDGETGFLVHDNSIDSIIDRILYIISIDELDKIVLNARKFIEQEYSYETAVKRYSNMIKYISNN